MRYYQKEANSMKKGCDNLNVRFENILFFGAGVVTTIVHPLIGIAVYFLLAYLWWQKRTKEDYEE